MSVNIYNVKNPAGRLGNQMFNLFLGKIISKELNFRLQNLNQHSLLDGFDLDYNNINQEYYENPIQYLNHCNFELKDIIEDKTPRKIILDHYFQQKRYYIPYRKDIKRWSNVKDYTINENDIGMHIRLGDLMDIPSQQHLLPIEYYTKAIDIIKNYNQINITTDSPTHDYIKILSNNYNCNVIEKTPKDSMDFLSNHKRLVLSQGSFSFWIGFLSDANIIINAIPKTGWNRLENRKTIDLLMNEPNYQNIIL